LNFRDPTASCKLGAWSTTCPVHSNDKEKCTKSLNLTDSINMGQGVHKLVLWCNEATGYADKHEHMALDPKGLPVLPSAELKRDKLTAEQVEAAGFQFSLA